MELFLKAGDDGKVVGDCPFAHYCRLVAALRGLPIKATPLSQATKPKWHLDAYKGSLPCLVIGGDTSAAVLESSAIAEKLNGLPATDFQLGVVGAPLDASSEAADAAVAGLFPAIARFLKNTATDEAPSSSSSSSSSAADASSSSSSPPPAADAGGDKAAANELAELEAALMEKLLALNAHLEATLTAAVAPSSTAGDAAGSSAGYMGGMTMAGGRDLGMADASLAPKLFHLSVAGAKFHPKFMREAFSATVDAKAKGEGGGGGGGGSEGDEGEGGSGGGGSNSGGGGAASDRPLKLGSLKAYMAAVFAHPAFVETAYPESQVVWGWGNARK